MANESEDYRAGLAFVRAGWPSLLAVAGPQGAARLSSLVSRLESASKRRNGIAERDRKPLRVVVSGWTELEGVLLIETGSDFGAEVTAAPFADNERALRDLLLGFPSGVVGLFLLPEDWMLAPFGEIFEWRRISGARDGLLGIKRGSGGLEGEGRDGAEARNGQTGKAGAPAGEPVISRSKDPLLGVFRELAHGAGRREQSRFVLEGPLLAERAIHDGLPLDLMLYTAEFAKSAGAATLSAARAAGVACFLVSDGIMGSLTTTRPVPTVMGAAFVALRDAEGLHASRDSTLLVVENVTNPDNLGMILRTADAAGVTAVVVSGEKTDPLHKNCVRAARGAVGRITICRCDSLPAYLAHLREQGFQVVGAALQGERELFRSTIKPPIAVIVGNEQTGITMGSLAECTAIVRIPMAAGQDSLNVGVAAGIMLYEVVRQSRDQSDCLPGPWPETRATGD